MKRISLLTFSLIFICVPASYAMQKRKLIQAPPAPPAVSVSDPEIDNFEECCQKVLERYDMKEDEAYPRRFYYVPTMPRTLVEKYCLALSLIHSEFCLLYYQCREYEDGASSNAQLRQNMEMIRPLLKQYTAAVIEKAKALQDSGSLKAKLLPGDSGSVTNWEATACVRVIQQEPLPKEWKKISDILLEHRLQNVRL